MGFVALVGCFYFLTALNFINKGKQNEVITGIQQKKEKHVGPTRSGTNQMLLEQRKPRKRRREAARNDLRNTVKQREQNATQQ